MNIFANYPVLETLAIVFTCLFFSLFFVNWGASILGDRINRQKKLIKAYVFPPSVKHHVLQTYPHLTDADVEIAFEQLRLYFLICWLENETLALPSKIVNACWQGFMLEQKNFRTLFRSTRTLFMHQIPKYYGNDDGEIGLKEGAKTFLAALSLVRVSGRNNGDSEMQTIEPTALHIPVLFSIDQTLNIPDGYRFTDAAILLLRSFEDKNTSLPRRSDM